jgi:hypothetical protein
MYEYILELLAEEKERFRINPDKYEQEIKNFTSNGGKFPILPKSRTNYAIAYAIQLIATTKELPSQNNELLLRGRDPTDARCAWTALMFLGQILPKQFDHKAIVNLVIGFDHNAEIGYFSRFSRQSLFENDFKKHINKDDIKYFLKKCADPTINNKIDESKEVDEINKNASVQKSSQEQKAEEQSLRSKYAAVSFVIFPVDKQGSPRGYRTVLRSDDTLYSFPNGSYFTEREWHINYHDTRVIGNYLSGGENYINCSSNGNFGRVYLKPLCSPYNTTLYPGSWSPSASDKETYINKLVCLKYQQSFIDTYAKNDKNEPIAIGALRASHCSSFTMFPMDFPMGFPRDGVLTKNSWFFESTYRYTYTLGLKDCMWLEGTNQKYSKYLEDEAIKQAEAEKVKQTEDKKAAESQKIEDEKKEKARLVKQEEDRISALNMKLHGFFSPENFPRPPSTIRSLIADKANVNHQDKDGYTPLMRAVDTDSDACVESLLKMGANPLIKNNYNEKASSLAASKSLIYPVCKGYELIASILIGDLKLVKEVCEDAETSSYINHKIHDTGRTALSLAAEKNRGDIVNYLLSMGADRTLADFNNKTPLEYATDNAVIRLLFNRDSQLPRSRRR